MSVLGDPLLAEATWAAPIDALIAGLLSALRALPFPWARELAEPLLGALLLGPLCGMVGVFVVNFRMAFFSDAIAHSAFSGVAIGLLLAASGYAWLDARWADPRVTLLLLGLLVGVLITTVKQRSDLGTDTIIGVAFAAVVALGIALITGNPEIRREFPKYLYGEVLLIDAAALRPTVLLTVAALLYLFCSFNRLTLIAFKPELAATRGTRVHWYDYSFAVLVVLLVTTTIPLTGMLLVTALLVVPAATARNLARGAGQMFWLAALCGLISGGGGLALAYYVNTAAGAAIILLGTALFAISLLVRRVRGG